MSTLKLNAAQMPASTYFNRNMWSCDEFSVELNFSNWLVKVEELGDFDDYGDIESTRLSPEEAMEVIRKYDPYAMRNGAMCRLLDLIRFELAKVV